MNRMIRVAAIPLVPLVMGLGYAQLAVSANTAAQAPQPLASHPDRAAFMQRHFASVMRVHEAVIRGDLAKARGEARSVADRSDPGDLPPAARPYLQSMQTAAARITGDSTLEDIAASTAAMLAACGDCHRAAGTMPATAPPSTSELGGGVGHMLAHKAAADLMLQGLTVPSTSSWNEGVKQLAAAPLRKNQMPSDPKLTKQILANETRVHELAERGLDADDVRSRIYVYSELVQTCANCHSLHGKVWGPGK